MPLSFHVLHAPKEGNTEAEYEDAFACGGLPGEENDQAAPPFVAAVADGASSSVFARQWARLLVDEFVSAPFVDGEAAERIALLGAQWREQVASESLPWYAQEKLTQGAHAALLLVGWDLAARTWSARAIGDACLFIVRGQGLHNAFPVTRSDAFDNRPTLISTETASENGFPLPPFHTAEGTCEEGDRFLLMTDALAAWFLAEAEAGRTPWDTFPCEQAQFNEWLQERRSDGTMRNDDVTLITVSCRSEQPGQSPYYAACREPAHFQPAG